MLSEKERGALRDMLRHIDLAEQFSHGHSYESLRDNLQALYAVIRSLEIISEASRRLSDELKARHADIPWREMAAAGNFYRHDYEDVTARRVWKTLLEDLPPLRASVDQELKRG
ncbi:MAG: hypothetical protein QOI05_1977 [Bradyrhizobium sp.]|jgi:uncharacterized protein with HEPN domain|nr:hypothetical protein [Bradyrhizobium sp.]